MRKVVSRTGGSSPSQLFPARAKLRNNDYFLTAGIRIKKSEEDLELGLIEPRYNLATKVMSNGVEVIVATDRNRPVEPEFLRLLSSTVTRPITLAPHTLTNHMSMVLASEKEDENDLVSSLIAANSFVTRTYYTTYVYLSTMMQNGKMAVSTHKATVANVRTEEAASASKTISPTSTREVTLTESPSLQTEIFHTAYTYLNTIVDGEQPLVMTSRYTISNTVTADYDYFNQLEPSEVFPTTNTYMKTIEFTKTLTDGTDSQVISTQNILTQVVVTDAFDRETIIKPMTTEVTKTYFVTYTYFSTYIDGDRTKVKSDVSVSSDVTIEKFYIKPKKTTKYTQRMTSVTRTAPVNIFATKTYLTTFTYFTTLLQGPSGEKPETIVTTRTRVMQNVVTETLSHKQFNEDYLLQLQNSVEQKGNIVTTATLKGGEQMEITVFKGGAVPAQATASRISEMKTSQSLDKSAFVKPSGASSSFSTAEASHSANDIKAEALVAENNELSETTVQATSLSNHRINQTGAVVITPSKTEAVASTAKIEDEGVQVKKPPKHPGENPINFLNLTSLGINGINVLGPVFNAMAELINNNIKNKVNETAPFKKIQPSKKPPPSNANPLLNFVSGLRGTVEPKHKSTTPRTPVYIPVGSFAEDHEAAESQSNIMVAQQWVDTQGKNVDKTRIDNGITILEGGIPISPGQIITTNSDVIIGRPGSSGPRPPNFTVKNNVPIDMKPPPPPPPPLTLEIPVPHVDDVIGQHSTIKNVKQGEHNHRHKPHDSGAADLNPPPAPPVLNVHRPITINHKPHEIVPYKPDHVETNIIPIPVHLMENYINGDVRHDVTEGQVIISKPTPSAHVFVKNEQIHSSMEDRSTGHPLLVNIQPSQVANIVIPPGSSTALIIKNENQHSLKGEVIDDPSPHPEPETVGFVGAEPVLRLENGDLGPPHQNIQHRPTEPNKPFRQQQQNVPHSGHHYYFQHGESHRLPPEVQNSRVPIFNGGHHYRDVIANKNPVKVGSGIYVDVLPPGHLPPRPNFGVGQGGANPSKPPGGIAENFSNHQSGHVHDVPLNAQVQLGSASNKDPVKDVLINVSKYDRVKTKHTPPVKNQNFVKKPPEEIPDSLHPPAKPVNRKPPRPYPPYHPQSPTNFMVPPPQVSHRPNYKPVPEPHPTRPLMIPVGAGAPDQIYPYPRPEDIVIVPHNVHSQQNNHFDLDTGDSNDPLQTEDGEELQESNSRPLLPGQLPPELERVNKTVDAHHVGGIYGNGRPYPAPPRPQYPFYYQNKTSDGLKINYGVHYADVYNEAEQIFGSKLNGNTVRVQRPAAPVQRPTSPIQRPQTPIQRPVTPIQRPQTPIQRPQTPVQRPQTPIQRPQTPVQRPQTPIQRPSAPVQRPQTPVQRPQAPVQRPVSTVPRPVSTQETSGSSKIRVEATIDKVPAYDRGNISWIEKPPVDDRKPPRPQQQSTRRPPPPLTTPAVLLDNLWISHGLGQTTRKPADAVGRPKEGDEKKKPVVTQPTVSLAEDKSENSIKESQWSYKPKIRPRPNQNSTAVGEGETDNRIQNLSNHRLNNVTQVDKNKTVTTNRHPSWVENVSANEFNKVPQQGSKKPSTQQVSGSENIQTQQSVPSRIKPATEKVRIPAEIGVVVDPQQTNDWIGTKPTIPQWTPNGTIFPQSSWHHEEIYRNRTSPSRPPSTAADINNLLTPPKTTEVMGLSPPPPERPRRPPQRPQRPKPPFKFEATSSSRPPIAIENDFPPVRSPDFNKKPIKPQDIFPPKLPDNFVHHVPEYPIRAPKPRPPPRQPVTSLPIDIPETQQASDTNEITKVFGSAAEINGHSKPLNEKDAGLPVKRPKPQEKPETVVPYEKPGEVQPRPGVAITPSRTETATTPTGNVIWGSETVFEPEEFSKYKTPIIKETTRKMLTTLVTTGTTTIFGDFYTPRPSEPRPTENKIAPTYTTTLTVTSTMTTVIHSVGQKPSTKTIVLTKTILSTVVDKVTETQTLVKPTTATVTQTHTIATTKTALIVPTAIHPIPTKKHPGATLKPEIFVADPHSKDTMTISVSTSMNEKTEEKRKPNGRRPETDKDSILVVMTNKHPKVNLSNEHFDVENDNVNGGGVFLGGVFHADTTKRYKTPIWQTECVPECRATRNERCQKVDGAMKCVCRPGFARMFPDRPCMPTYTYNMKLLLDKSEEEEDDYASESESTSYVKLKALTKEGLDRMIMQSDLRDIFHGVSVNGFEPSQKKMMVDFYVQLSENTDESRLTNVFRKTLRHSNYSLGGTQLYAAREGSLEAEDFNECLNPKFHDCSENARCFNLRGTYTCSCKEGFTDLSENSLFPGRLCSDMIGCEYCGYHGTCYTLEGSQTMCECFQWYSGERCRINLKVLLIALVTIGSILLALLLVCGVITCLKRKNRNSAGSRANGSSGYLRYRGPPTQSLDKRAMIAADSSSESSVENLPYINPPPPPPPSGTLSAKKKSVLRQNGKGPAPRPKELSSVEQQDRSVTVMIPRAKYRPVPPMSPLLTMSTFSPDKHIHRTSAQISTEQKLINYLEGNSREGGSNGEQKSNQKTYDTPRAAPPFKREQRVFEYEYKTSNMQINDGTSSGERRSSKHGDSEKRFRRHSDSTHMNSENSRNFRYRKYSAGALVSAGYEVSATVGLRHNDFDTSEDEHSGILNTSTMKSNRSQFTTLNRTGDHKTMSEARSYDETTIHPPTRTLKTNYSGSSPSSRVNNDEGHTMVERDLGSTFIMPESHLFKPERDRGSDISTFDSL